jgi:hypothetical protein
VTVPPYSPLDAKVTYALNVLWAEYEAIIRAAKYPLCPWCNGAARNSAELGGWYLTRSGRIRLFHWYFTYPRHLRRHLGLTVYKRRDI